MLAEFLHLQAAFRRQKDNAPHDEHRHKQSNEDFYHKSSELIG